MTQPPRQGRPWFTLRLGEQGVELLDQRRLPAQEIYLTLSSVEEVAHAIEDLAVRGAPAIGCAAALGLALAARRSRARDVAGLRAELSAAAERLARTRPTAANLFWALGRLREATDAAASLPGATPAGVAARVVEAARRLVEEDAATCCAIGAVGARFVPDGARILTHCNAGALATAGYGTALGVVRAAVESGRRVSVFAGETRPFLQGARLTAWELDRDGIAVTVITDGMAGFLMQRGEVTSSWWAPTASPPTATWRTRSGPIPSRSSPDRTASPSTSRRRSRPSISRRRAGPTSPSRSGAATRWRAWRGTRSCPRAFPYGTPPST